MKYLYIGVLLVLVMPVLAFGQAPDSLWDRTYWGSSRDDVCYSAAQTSDSGDILAGYSSLSVNSTDFWLVKTNASGDSLWSRYLGGGSHEFCYCVQQTSDGGYMLAGHSNSFWVGSYYDFWLVKTGADYSQVLSPNGADNGSAASSRHRGNFPAGEGTRLGEI